MATQWFDNMSWSAALGPGQPQAARPTAQQLGFIRTGYFNNGYFATSATVNGVETVGVDAAKAREIGNCLPFNVDSMFDFETWLAKCATYAPVPAPAPNRLTYQRGVVLALEAVRSTPRGASCRYFPYQAALGIGAHDFGAAWLNANLSTLQTIFLEPVPGAPNGIGALFERKLVSVYRRYSNWSYDAQRIAWHASVMRQLYPGERICAGVNPRIVAADAGSRRYDYLTEQEMDAYLNVVQEHFDDIAPWCWNGYGPEGTPASQRNASGYAIVPGTGAINGDGWHGDDAGWWRAMKRRLRGPIVTTMPVGPGGGVQTGGPITR
jgi:hypothetical protein